MVVVALALAACGPSGGADPTEPSTAVIAAAVTAAPATTEPATTEPATTTTPAPTTTLAPTTTTTVLPSRRSGWIVGENALPGTDAWRITARDPLGWIEGYAAATSAHPGDQLALYVDTGSPAYTVEAYRMGFYGGKQGRLVWTSEAQTGRRQPAPDVDPATGLAVARWTPSLAVPIGADWPPGAYLLKLVSSARGSSYVPLTVRDDDAHADLLVVNAVTTWQSYNQWGACSLYSCGGLTSRNRGVKVSFDRPYARQFGDGSADYLDHEQPLIALAEELGIDLAFATSIDLHEHPDLATRYRGVLSLGHDEYYSTRMRQALVDARDKGVNLAFFGANAVYRHIRFEPAADGRADRVMVNYRTGDDPIGRSDQSEITVEWRMQGKPEAQLVGIQYLCANLHADLVVSSAAHWIWAGAGVREGQALRDLVGNEADGRFRAFSPGNLDLLAQSPVVCDRKTKSMAHTSYYSASSGAGVFASGTIWWVCALEAQFCSRPENVAPVRAATGNVLRVFAQGPAGTTHPSGTRPGAPPG